MQRIMKDRKFGLKNARELRVLVSVSILATALPLGQAFAQSEEEAGKRSRLVDKIVVTAQRRDEFVQDVPISMSAFTASDLEQSAIDDVFDLQFVAPGLTVDKSTRGGGRLFLRGVGNTTTVSVGIDTAVALYIDDVYIPRTNAAFTEFLDLERIEVLRGPQGTLYGRNAVGGAVKVYTAQPQQEFGFKGDVEYGKQERIRLRGSANIPIIEDKLSVRASGMYSERDQYGYNSFKDERLKGEDLMSGRFSVLFTPTNKLSMRLAVDASNDDAFGVFNPRVLQGAPVIGGDAAVDNEAFVFQQDADEVHESNDLGINGRIVWDLGSVTATSITSYRKFDMNIFVDGDASEIFLINAGLESETETFSQEFLLSSNDAGRFEWTVGVNAFVDDGILDLTVPLNLGAIIPLPIVQTTNTVADVKATSFGVFGSGTYHLNDNWAFTFGARYSWEKKDYNVSLLQVAESVIFPMPMIAADLNSQGEPTWESITPRFVVEYEMNNALIFASVSRGFKSGAVNPFDVVTDPLSPNNITDQVADPESLWAYEFGFKSDWFDNRIQANGAIFYYDYSDLQVQVANSTGFGASDVTVANAARAKVTGAELQLLYKPTPAWLFSANFTLIDPTYKEFMNNGNDFSGQQMKLAPKFTSNFAAQYMQDMGSVGSLTLRGEASITSDVPLQVDTSLPFTVQDGYTLFNAHVTYNSPDNRWFVSGYVKNISDKAYGLIGGASGFAGTFHILGDPRVWAIKTGVNF